MDEYVPGNRPAHAPPPATPSGLRGVSSAFLQYLEARGVILSIEAQEAVQQVLRLLVFALLGGIFAFTGWLLATAVVLSLLVDRVGWTWQLASGVVGGAYIVLAGIFFATVANRITATQWFVETFNEFKKDRAWLANQTDKH